MKKRTKIWLGALAAFLLLPVALNIGVFAVNDIGAAFAERELMTAVREEDISVVSSGCRVGRFNACGNGAQYLTVAFLSDIPEDGTFKGYDLYTPEGYRKNYGFYIAPPDKYACAVVGVSSPGNWFLYDFDLRGH